MHHQIHALACLALVGSIPGLASDERKSTIDLARASRYFQEARTLADADHGKLWGVSLQGPMMFVDPRTRAVVANQADTQGKLRPEGGIFVGQLPDNIPPANNAIEWAGVRWTMVLWPLPQQKDTRSVLLMHESWHRIQTGLGLPPKSPANHHLDTLEGRFWVQLEWRALARALGAEADNRRIAIQDALSFRTHRRSLFPDAAEEERGLEMNEGLAEYTGVKLSGMDGTQQARYTIKQLKERPSRMSTFVRSFAYLSGPAYGLLLDGADWRSGLKPKDDLGSSVQVAFGLPMAQLSAEEIQQRAQQYDGTSLRREETRREQARQERQAKLRARFVDSPVLILPLRNAQFSFDPNGAQPLGDHGTVYSVLQISDAWGTLKALKGGLMARDFQKAFVPAPADISARPVKGDGWELHLVDGWVIKPAARNGDFELRQQK